MYVIFGEYCAKNKYVAGESDKEKFYVGKVLSIDKQEETLTVRYYQNGKKNKNERGVFRPWMGKEKNVLVEMEDIVVGFHSFGQGNKVPLSAENEAMESIRKGKEFRRIVLLSQIEDDDEFESEEELEMMNETKNGTRSKQLSKKAKGRGRGGRPPKRRK